MANRKRYCKVSPQALKKWLTQRQKDHTWLQMQLGLGEAAIKYKMRTGVFTKAEGLALYALGFHEHLEISNTRK